MLAAVHGALGRAGAHDGVQLVDEQDDVAALLHLIQGVLDALLELAAALCSGHHAAQVQRQDALVEQLLGHIAGGNRARPVPRRWQSCRTPGSPMRTGLFFVRREQDLDDAAGSRSSRPSTGYQTARAGADSVRSRVNSQCRKRCPSCRCWFVDGERLPAGAAFGAIVELLEHDAAVDLLGGSTPHGAQDSAALMSPPSDAGGPSAGGAVPIGGGFRLLGRPRKHGQLHRLPLARGVRPCDWARRRQGRPSPCSVLEDGEMSSQSVRPYASEDAGAGARPSFSVRGSGPADRCSEPT